MATVREQLEAKYGKSQTSDLNQGVSVRSQLEAKYKTPITERPFDIPLTQEDKARRLANAQAEAKKAQKYAKANTGFFDVTKNTLKGIGSTLASSEVGLGKTIAKTFGNQSTNYADTISKLNKTQSELLKLISSYEKTGRDATNLKRAFNENIQQLKQAQAGLTEETTLPTTGKVVGQLGGTALDLLTAGTYGKVTEGMKSFKLASNANPALSAVKATIPELSKVGEVAQKSSGLFTKQGLKNIGIGTGIGYGFDVTQGLQGERGEDRTGGKAFIPGLGTAIGFGIPFATETTKTIKNVNSPEYKTNKLIEKRKSELDKLDNYTTLKKAVEKGSSRDIDIKQVLADTDVLHGAVDKTGNITTKGKGGAIEQYTNQFINGNEDLVSKALKKENAYVSKDLIKARLKKNILNSGIEGKALTNALKSIDDELAGYALRSTEKGLIPLETLHKAKIDKYNSINFFTEGNTKKLDKVIANTLKEIVENETKSVDVKAINKELSKHFAVIDYLERLDNKKVAGGRLGKYFAQTVGSIVGSHFGPVGAVVGAEAGGRIKGNIMSRAFSGKTGRTLPQAKAFLEAENFLNKKPLGLQSKSNNLGSLNINQAITNIPTKNVISKSSPEIGTKSSSLIERIKNTPNKQGGFIKIGKESNSIPPKPKVNESVSLPNSNTELIKEAKKYKTAEEFVKAQGEIPASHIKNELGEYLNYNKNDVFIKKELPLSKIKNKNTLEDYGGAETQDGSEIVELMQSIRKNGFNTRIVVDENGKVLDGNHRIVAMRELGIKNIPVYEKTKSQLEEIWKKANQATPESSLINEAKKYKSAEEFVKAQGTPIYHGSNEKIKIFSNKKGAQGVIWFTDNPKAITAGESGAQGTKFINERITTGKKFAGWDEYEKLGLGQIQDMGFDGVKLPTKMQDGTAYNDYILFDNKTIKTKSQLTEIWNNANKIQTPETSLIQEAKKYKSAEEFWDWFAFKKKDPVVDGKSVGKDFAELSPLVSNRKTSDFLGFGEYKFNEGVLKGKIGAGEKLTDGKVNHWKERISKGERPVIIVEDKPYVSKITDHLQGGREYDAILEARVRQGHSRLEAYKQLGIKEVPVVYKSQLTDIWNKANAVSKVDPLISEAKKYKTAEEFVKAQGTSVYHGSDKLFTTTDDIKFGDDFFYTLKRTDGELKEIAENVTADSYYSYDDLAKMPANAFGENVSEFVVKFKNPKIIDAKGKSWLDLTDGSMSDWTAKIVDQAKKSGEKYDGIIIKNIEEGFSSKGTLGASAGLVDDYIVLDKSALQTKSQLEEIWKQANKKSNLPKKK